MLVGWINSTLEEGALAIASGDRHLTQPDSGKEGIYWPPAQESPDVSLSHKS
jgi:hypothetical protein